MSFTDDIDRFRSKVRNNSTLVIRKIAIEMLRRVVMRTPVGNPALWQSSGPAGYVGGTARGNWMLTTTSPATGTEGAPDASGSRALTRALPALQGWVGQGSIFIVNNLPYITRLESGWSSQAPHGMVAVTVAEFQGIVEQEAKP